MDSENKSIQENSPTPSSTEVFNRRDFLKLAGLGLATIYSPRLLRNREGNSEDQESEAVREIARSIEKELGLTTKDVKFTMMFGNHVLQDDHMQILNGERNLTKAEEEIWGEPKPYDTLVGEIDDGLITFDLLSKGVNFHFGTVQPSVKEVIERILYPSVGAGKEEWGKHISHLQNFFRKGSSIYITDAQIWSYLDHVKKPLPISSQAMALRDITLGIAGIAALGTLYSGMKKKQGEEKTAEITKNITKAVVKSGTGALLVGGMTMYLHTESKIKDGRNVETGDVTDFTTTPLGDPEELIGTTENLLNEIKGMYGEEVDPTEIIVDLRNKIMALNSWCAISDECISGEGLKQIAFFAGSGHVGAFNEFLKGPDVLQEELKTLIKQVLSSVDPDSYVTELLLLQIFNTYSRVSLKSGNGLERKAKKVPTDTRTLLIESVTEEVDRTDPKGRRAETLRSLLNSFTEATVYRSLEPLKRTYDSYSLESTTIPQEVEDSSKILLNDFWDNPEIDGGYTGFQNLSRAGDESFLFSLGIVKHKGRYLPLLINPQLEYINGEDRITNHYLALLSSGSYAKIGESVHIPKPSREIAEDNVWIFIDGYRMFVVKDSPEFISRMYFGGMDPREMYTERIEGKGIEPFGKRSFYISTDKG